MIWAKVLQWLEEKEEWKGLGITVVCSGRALKSPSNMTAWVFSAPPQRKRTWWKLTKGGRQETMRLRGKGKGITVRCRGSCCKTNRLAGEREKKEASLTSLLDGIRYVALTKWITGVQGSGLNPISLPGRRLTFYMGWRGGHIKTSRRELKAEQPKPWKPWFLPEDYFSHSHLLWEVLSLTCLFTGCIRVLPKEGLEIHIHLTH